VEVYATKRDLTTILVTFIPSLPPEELSAHRALMLANNEIVMKEME
jgi:hypothetical protein